MVRKYYICENLKIKIMAKYRAYSRKWKRMVLPNDPEIRIHVYGDGSCTLWNDCADDEVPHLMEYTDVIATNGEVCEDDWVNIFIKRSGEVVYRDVEIAKNLGAFGFFVGKQFMPLCSFDYNVFAIEIVTIPWVKPDKKTKKQKKGK